MERVKLWFGPGGKEGYKWASNYQGSLVGLCRQPFCENCNLIERERLRGFRGGELEVELIPYRRPTFWKEEIFYLGHLVRVPEREVARAVGVDEGIEFDISRLNTLLLSTARGSVLIDPGVMGFNGDEFGFQKLISGRKIVATIVTHGHLDHWNHLNAVPSDAVFMSALTFQLISRHAAWQQDSRLVRALRKAQRVSPGEPVLLERDLPIQIETFPLPHSIPETMGLIIKGRKKRIVYLGDFKLTGVDAKTKAETISFLYQIAKEPVDLLSLNIINAHLEGFTPLEGVTIEAITNIIVRAKGRVIITSFSTNLERIRRIGEIAQIMGRPILFLGAGMANAQGLLNLEVEEMADAEKTVIFVTGCQAEESSALWRSAYELIPPLALRPTDTLIFSSRCIPGNEAVLRELITALRPKVGKIIVNARETEQVRLQGMEVEEAPVHVTGHEQKEGLRLVLEILRPKQILPWPQSSPQIEAFREIAGGIEILNEKNRVIEI